MHTHTHIHTYTPNTHTRSDECGRTLRNMMMARSTHFATHLEWGYSGCVRFNAFSTENIALSSFDIRCAIKTKWCSQRVIRAKRTQLVSRISSPRAYIRTDGRSFLINISKFYVVVCIMVWDFLIRFNEIYLWFFFVYTLRETLYKISQTVQV